MKPIKRTPDPRWLAAVYGVSERLKIELKSRGLTPETAAGKSGGLLTSRDVRAICQKVLPGDLWDPKTFLGVARALDTNVERLFEDAGQTVAQFPRPPKPWGNEFKQADAAA